MNKRISNNLALGALWVAAMTTVVILFAIIGYVVVNGIRQVLDISFVTSWPHGVNSEGGILPIITNTLYVTALAMLITTPIAVLAAVYLTEYAVQGRMVRIIRFAADSLASVPSIVMGLFGFALFVEAMGWGFSMLAGAAALSFLMLPIVMRATEEAIRAVPKYIRWGSYGMGATKWQTVSRAVLPAAAPRIITGIILAMGRAAGETAVVLYTVGQAIGQAKTPLESGRVMPVHLYLLAMEGINLPAAYGTALVLMILIFGLNLTARWVLKRYRKV